MNANELEEQIKYLQDPLQNADYCHDYENGTVLEYLLTIRQQQAEIEELKILFDKTLNNWAKDMERAKVK